MTESLAKKKKKTTTKKLNLMLLCLLVHQESSNRDPALGTSDGGASAEATARLGSWQWLALGAGQLPTYVPMRKRRKKKMTKVKKRGRLGEGVQGGTYHSETLFTTRMHVQVTCRNPKRNVIVVN